MVSFTFDDCVLLVAKLFLLSHGKNKLIRSLAECFLTQIVKIKCWEVETSQLSIDAIENYRSAIWRLDFYVVYKTSTPLFIRMDLNNRFYKIYVFTEIFTHFISHAKLREKDSTVLTLDGHSLLYSKCGPYKFDRR